MNDLDILFMKPCANEHEKERWRSRWRSLFRGRL